MTSVDASCRVVFYKEAERWIAQGLEYDLTASGATIPEALEELGWLIAATVAVNLENGRAPLADVPSSPQDFFALAEA